MFRDESVTHFRPRSNKVIFLEPSGISCHILDMKEKTPEESAMDTIHYAGGRTE
jgi:hypothetical protein